MRLKSFGCSFIYGSDLKDCPHGEGRDHPPPSQFTWPALLAARNGLDYECHARPASSNLQILETLLSQTRSDYDAVYVINWTWIDRFGFLSSEASSGLHPWNPLGWCSILPSADDAVADMYYRHLHSQFRDKLESLVCVKTAADVLIDKNIRFLMTYTDNLMFETEWHVSPAITCLQNYASIHMQDFEKLSYWDWIKTNDFEITEKWHPLEKAHLAAADLMDPVIDAILRRV